MRPVERGTISGSYLGESVIVVAMDDINEMGRNATCEIEYESPLNTTRPGTRKVVPFGDVEGLHGSGVAHRT